MSEKADARIVTKNRRKNVKDRRKNPILAATLLTNQRIRLTGELPKPRVEVRKLNKGHAFRLIDKYGRKGEWSERFTLRNNTRRAARAKHPDVPVISQ